MAVNPLLKSLFPEKTDDEIIYGVHNPCQFCEYCSCEEDCRECVLGRLVDFFEAHQPKDTPIKSDEFNDYNIALNG